MAQNPIDKLVIVGKAKPFVNWKNELVDGKNESLVEDVDSEPQLKIPTTQPNMSMPTRDYTKEAVFSQNKKKSIPASIKLDQPVTLQSMTHHNLDAIRMVAVPYPNMDDTGFSTRTSILKPWGPDSTHQ